MSDWGKVYEYILNYDTLPDEAFTIDNLNRNIVRIKKGSSERIPVEAWIPLKQSILDFKNGLNQVNGIDSTMENAFDMGSRLFWGESFEDKTKLLENLIKVNQDMKGTEKMDKEKMNIKVEIYPIDGKVVKAAGSVTIGNMIKIDDVTVRRRGDGGRWVEFPAKAEMPKNHEGKKELAYPITREMREQIVKSVLDEYDMLTTKEKNFTVNVFPIKEGKGLLANANLVLNNEFVVTGFKLAQNEKSGKVNVFFPSTSYIDADGNKIYKEVVHSASKGMKDSIRSKIIDEYNNQVEKEHQIQAEANFKRDNHQQMDSEPLSYEKCPTASRKNNANEKKSEHTAEMSM